MTPTECPKSHQSRIHRHPTRRHLGPVPHHGRRHPPHCEPLPQRTPHFLLRLTTDSHPHRPAATTGPLQTVTPGPNQVDKVKRELTLARWDWPKPASRPGGGPIINARIEKLPTGFWVGAFSNSRCIVPMAPGYFEWTGPKGSKQPHLIAGDGILAAAGLTWTTDIAGERQRVFVVITREARDASGEIHDRMPAFITDDLRDDWLNPTSLTIQNDSAASKRNRLELLDELDASSSAIAETMRTHLIDPRMNNARTVDRHDPTLLEPIDQPS